MKRFISFLFAAFSIIGLSAQDNRVLMIDKGWKFISGDHPQVFLPDYDDANMKSIEVNKIWEEQGYDPLDGFCWYRLHMVIPSELKTKAILQDSLFIYLGKINNFDQTYLNGHLIGVNGFKVTDSQKDDLSFIKAPTNYWDRPRAYKLALNDSLIRWDKENIIAVRVYDEGGQGGMYTGDQFIRLTCFSDYISLECNGTPYHFNGNTLSKQIKIRNVSSAYFIRGKLEIIAINKLTGHETFHQSLKVKLRPADVFDFHLELPQMDHSQVVTYRYSIKSEGSDKIYRDETPYILTPPVKDTPQINGPYITGARPHHPFLFTIPVTGEKPLNFEVKGLPNGLVLNNTSGIISGMVEEPGEYRLSIKVSNALGSDFREMIVKIGPDICLTPPMGWNSWNCWGLAVDQEKIADAANAFVNEGLRDHGWTYVNIDDGWNIHKDAEPKRDDLGNILPNEKFPDMKGLGDAIHSLGLKMGIYSSPGPYTCGQYTGSYQFEQKDAQSYASWGVDYLKYDWCSYDQIARDTSLVERKKPYHVMKEALNQVNRDIAYSLCQYGMSKVWRWGAEVGGNLWRTTGDITDTWGSLKSIGFSQVENQPYAGPGHWNDPDMLVVGWVGWGPNLHPTRLTPDEQYTHISLWCLLSAPLLLGCDLQQLDPFTLNLLTNDEVLAINQDALGYQAKQILVEGDIQVWIKKLSDGTFAIGIFNLGDKTHGYHFDFAKTGLPQQMYLRNVWKNENLGHFIKGMGMKIPSHGVILLRQIP
ncbi:MAG TPA: putative Ig domain-containing protein [Bacteroidales bacterium]|nr:putative Ig domain-containing protein [Bacteroidales bacterium]HQI51551.1 putative Ig domain-containing protein [Bacteroidales bacterium]